MEFEFGAKWRYLSSAWLITGNADRGGCRARQLDDEEIGGLPTKYNFSVNEDLRTALSEMKLERAAELLRAGADINARNAHGDTLLNDFISTTPNDPDRLKFVRFMLEHGADPSLIDSTGGGPLFSAVIARDTETMRLLLDHGADPNREREYFTTLYDYALSQYHFEVLDLKFAEDATNADKASDDAWLHYLDRLAVKYGKRRPDYLFLLRERGALTTAEMQRLRIENRVLYSQYRSVSTQLHEALLEVNLEWAAELLRSGADINARNEHGVTLLNEIIQPINEATDRRKVVAFMLEHGADPRLIDKESSGPLFYAVLAMDTEVLRLLLDHGADPNRETDDGESLYDYAEFDYRYETYDLKLPEEATVADEASEETWLNFLDRLAIKYGKRRPDHLFLLRERGALTTAELKFLPVGKAC